MAKQVEIKQGISTEWTLDVSKYHTQGVEWRLAIVSPATNMRYVADVDESSTETTKVFVFPSGLKQDSTGALVLDPEHKNGTAHMSVGVYNIEAYTADRDYIAVAYGGARVLTSNLMAKNTAEGEEPPQQ